MTHDKLEIWLYSIYSIGTEDITVAQIMAFQPKPDYTRLNGWPSE